MPSSGWVAAEGKGKPRLAAVAPEAAVAAAAANASWLEDCIVRIVCVLALDRFADYVSDQVGSHLQSPLLIIALSSSKAINEESSKSQSMDSACCGLAQPGCSLNCRSLSVCAVQAVAPVRETAAQALGGAVQPLSVAALQVLLGQLQALAASEQWEVRHSGLLALKYVVAARPDAAAQLLPLAVSIATSGLQVCLPDHLLRRVKNFERA